MALTRKFLAAMGIEDAQVQAIIDAHMETVSGLQDEIKGFKDKVTKAEADSKTLVTVQTELDELKKADYKGKYEAEKTAHDALKTSIETEKTKGAKEAALKAYFESKNIKDGNLTIAMRGVKLDDIELEDDKIKDTKALDELVAGDYKPLVTEDKGGAGNKGKGGKVVDSGAKVGGNGGDDSGKVLSLKDSLRQAYDE